MFEIILLISFLGWGVFKCFFEKLEINKILECDLPFRLYLSKKMCKNLCIKESKHQHVELAELIRDNKLIAFRSGNIESAFFLKCQSPFWKLYQNIDNSMKKHAGFYYKDSNRRIELINWWTNHYKEIYTNAISCPLYSPVFLQNDIQLWSIFKMKGHFYNWYNLSPAILQNSEGKKILYIGAAVNSIKKGFERGLQSVWKFDVTNFSMYYLQTPQTTEGCSYPHDSMIETVNDLIERIEENFSDFDTAIFGCGAYGAPLMNILRKKYKNKNLIYLGSHCFKMFGIKTNEIWDWEECEPLVHKDKLIQVEETLPLGCKNHPEKKYWKLPLGFIILRNVNSEKTNKYWIECYTCIRKFYPTNKILIIDDNSNTDFLTEIPLTNTEIINSEFKNCGELLPYIYYLKHKFEERVVVLHDSVFIRKHIDFGTDNISLWEADLNDKDVHDIALLKKLSNSHVLIDLYHSNKWKVCFGGMSVISYDFLVELNSKYNFSNLIDYITCRKDRMAFERILGLLLNSSLFGNILNFIHAGYSWEEYSTKSGLNKFLIYGNNGSIRWHTTLLYLPYNILYGSKRLKYTNKHILKIWK